MPDNNDFTEIYLDNASTTRPFDEVISFMSNICKNVYANPSSVHRKGLDADKLINEARQKVADNMGVNPSQIVFTSGGTESNNLAIQGYLAANRRFGNHILCSPIEHPSILEVMHHLSDLGYDVEYMAVNGDGKIDIESLSRKLRNTTCLVAMMLVNNETGGIQSVATAAELIRKSGSPAALHVDAVQGYGKIPFTPFKHGISSAAVSAHKIHGPKGVGALYIREGVKIKSLFYGGGQEGTVRSGTENVAGIAGFGLAAEMTGKQIQQNYERISRLKENFIGQLKSKVGGVIINSETDSSPYIVNVSFKNVKSQVLRNNLDQHGIYVSGGSACSARKKQRSYVLQAAGIDNDLIDSALRFSFGLFNTEREISDTINVLTSIMPGLRRNYQ